MVFLRGPKSGRPPGRLHLATDEAGLWAGRSTGASACLSVEGGSLQLLFPTHAAKRRFLSKLQKRGFMRCR